MGFQFLPLDRTKCEHVGKFSQLVWHDDDTPAVIVRLSDGASAIGPAKSEDFLTGQQYRFFGRWEEGKFGPQFRFSTIVIDAPSSRAGVVKYLSDVCSGVGKATAEALWKEYGGDCVRILREQPSKVVADKVLSEEYAAIASRELQEYKHTERTRIDLFELFSGRGIPGKAIQECIAKWGVAAVEKIKKNPYLLLLNRIPGCGFKRTDKMYLDLGHKPDALRRQAVAAWDIIRRDRTGSTWLDAREVSQEIVAECPTATSVKALKMLRRIGAIQVKRIDEKRYVALSERAKAEQRIADAVARLNRSPSLWPTDIPRSVLQGDGFPSVHQAEQLRAATTKPIGAYIGGPGTGKTHSLSFLLSKLIDKYGEQKVAVIAPTGKASVRAGESLRARGLSIKATTIHRYLEIGRNGKDGEGWGFQRNRDNPVEQRFVVVDESSMIDAGLLADLLDAIPDGGHVLLIGDPFQLPPVGTGAPLRDLLAAGIPCGELTEIRRNAGAIVHGCAAIKHGRVVEFSEAVDLACEMPKNLKFVECTQEETGETLVAILSAMTRFDPAWQTQVIVPLNDKSECSRKLLNERLSGLLNPNGLGAGGNPFRCDDKIICTRNGEFMGVVQVKSRAWGVEADASSYQKSGVEEYVANGEIGRVVAVNPKASIVRFGGNGDDSRLVMVPVGKGRPEEGAEQSSESGSAGDFELAWAITVHKSQGSEWPCVICVVDPAGTQVADRNFWYTAISRASKLCLLVGPKPTFETQRRRQTIDRRRTFLTELVRDSIAPTIAPRRREGVNDGGEATASSESAAISADA